MRADYVSGEESRKEVRCRSDETRRGSRLQPGRPWGRPAARALAAYFEATSKVDPAGAGAFANSRSVLDCTTRSLCIFVLPIQTCFR